MFETYSAVINYTALLLIIGVAVQLWFAARLFLFASGMFMLIGTYASIHLVMDGQSVWIGVVIAFVAAVAAGLVVGWLLGPLDGLYLGLASLAVSEVVRIIATQNKDISGGPDGFVVPAIVTPQTMLIVAAVVVFLSWSYQRAYSGPLRTINFDPRVAESLGIRATSYQRLTLALGAGLAGAAAFLYACTSFVVTPAEYGFNILVLSLTVAVIGGRNHWLGPVVGAAVIGILPQVYTSLEKYTVMMSGLILLAVLIFSADGLVPGAIRLGKHFLTGRRALVSEDEAVGERDDDAWKTWLDRVFGEPVAPDRADTVLDVDHVDFRYGGVHALRDVSFTASRGEVLGIVGPNGAGKTTLMNALSGVARPTSGQVRYFGDAVKKVNPTLLVERGVMRTFQKSYLVPDLSVVENLALGRARVGSSLFGIEIGREAIRDRREIAELSVRAFGLDAVEKLEPEELPLGTRRLVEVLRAVNQGPRLLLLDEPTAGMDADEVRRFEELLIELSGRGVTILLISHDLDVIQKTCHRIHVLSLGESIADVPASEMLTDPRIADAYLGRQESRL